MIFEFPMIKDQCEFITEGRGDKLSLKKDEISEKTRNKKNINFKRRQ